MRFRRTQSGTIGLYRGTSRDCLVRLSCEAGQWVVTAEQITESTGEAGAFGSLLERLDRRADEATLGLAIDGAHGLYRSIDLPPAERDETDRIIAVQVETMVPGHLEQVRWSWARSPLRGPAVACVSTLQQLEQATQTLPDGIFADSAVPLPFALDALFTSVTQPSKLVVVAMCAHHTQLMIYAGNGLTLIETIDTDCPANDRDAAEWIWTLVELIERSIRGWSVENQPTSLMCLAAGIDVSALQNELGARLSLTPMSRQDVCEIKGLVGDDLDVLIAAGAGIVAADPHDTRNLLGDPQHVVTARRVPRRAAWIAAGVWLLVALAGLYAITLNNAERYESAIADSQISSARIAALDRSVTLARYLETQGPAFVAILDEIGQVTEGFMLDEIRYDRGGQIIISGTLGSADALNQFASDLAGMKTIDSIQIRNQATFDRDKVKYTLVAHPSTRFFGGFVQPPTPQVIPSSEVATRPGADSDSEVKPPVVAEPVSDDEPPSDEVMTRDEAESAPTPIASEAVAPLEAPNDPPEASKADVPSDPKPTPQRKRPS